jgi:hypothetical protein
MHGLVALMLDCEAKSPFGYAQVHKNVALMHLFDAHVLCFLPISYFPSSIIAPFNRKFLGVQNPFYKKGFWPPEATEGCMLFVNINVKGIEISGDFN